MLGNSQRFSRDYGAAAKILDKRNPLFLCERADVVRGNRFDKTAHGKIAAMHFQNHCRVRTNGMLVIFECCFVRCADFAQFRAARLENFGDAKPTADLHQFAS